MSTDPRLAVVLNLLRIYRDVLDASAPADLTELLSASNKVLCSR